MLTMPPYTRRTLTYTVLPLVSGVVPHPLLVVAREDGTPLGTASMRTLPKHMFVTVRREGVL